jgi:hypothetical protein
LFSDDFQQVGLNEYPLAADLRAGHDTRAGTPEQRILAYAQECRRVNQADCG